MHESGIKLVILRWPSGEITVALDRDYTPEQIESFGLEDPAGAAEADC